MKINRSAGPDAPALEWLSDLSGKSARITSIGSKTLLVENHRGVLLCQSDRVMLASGCGAVEISGENLRLCDVRPDALIIRGSIRHISLPCMGEHSHEN